MGDNIWLGDRDGVRTPMQWTADRNAGFSSATPGKLDRPVIQDPVFGYQSVNVEAQLENSSSLLHWTRRMIHARRNHPAFGLGEFHDLGGSNPSVLSYVREHVDADGREDLILCVNNLSRFPQPVELDLRRFEGRPPGRAARRGAVPRDRRAALPAHPGRLRLLLVPADRAGAHRGGPAAVTAAIERTRSVRAIPRADPLVRRQGPAVRDRVRAPHRRGPARERRGAARGDRPGRGRVRRRAGRQRDLPGADGALHRPGDPARPRLHRLVGGADVRLGARLRRAPRPRGDGAVAAGVRPWPRASRAATSTTRAGCASTGSRATTSTWTRTRRCSRASSRTRRSRSARTR